MNTRKRKSAPSKMRRQQLQHLSAAELCIALAVNIATVEAPMPESDLLWLAGKIGRFYGFLESKWHEGGMSAVVEAFDEADRLAAAAA